MNNGVRVITGPLGGVGGTVPYILGLAKYSKFRPVVLRYSRLSVYSPKYRGIPYVLVRHPLWSRLDPYSAFVSLVRLRNYDIVHTHGHPAWVGLYAWSRTKSRKRIHTVHQIYRRDDFPDAEAWAAFSPLNELMISYCRDANVVITVSDYGSQVLLAEYGIESIVIRPAVDPQEFEEASASRARSRWRLPQDFFLFAGGNLPQKGLNSVLQLARVMPDFLFVLAGTGTSSDKIALRHPAGDMENVRGLGLLSRKDFLDCLAACRVLLIPSRQETFGTLSIEGMMMGKPIVASRIPAFCETIEDCATGFLFESSNGEEFREVSERAWYDERIGARAHVHAKKSHSWPLRAAEIDAVYGRVADG